MTFSADHPRGMPLGVPVWLFPATYVVHLLEETFAGESFPVWLAQLRGGALPWRAFVVINAVAFAVVCVASIGAASARSLRFLVGVLGTIVAANALLHLGASVATGTYSPGVVSGVLLWLPLGIVALRAVFFSLGRAALWRGVGLGLAAHTAVSYAAMYAGR